MTTVTIIVFVLLGILLLLLGFVLLGALRTLSLLTWRVDQLEATTPGRLNRNGLPRGERAPQFTLPDLHGNPLALDVQRSGNVLLVFVQSRCGPCHAMIPELNALQRRRRDVEVLAVLHADPDEVGDWVIETRPEFPVALQEDWSLSKRYEVFATPFAFLIDERGMIASKGILTQRQHIGLLFSTAERSSAPELVERDRGDVGAKSPMLQVP